MRSRVSRAMAAVIFVLAITEVAVWFHGLGATPALADFIQPILEAKTVKYKTTVEMKGPPAVTIAGEEMVLDAARSRSETEMPGAPKTVQITDWRQGKSLSLIPALKRATVLKYSNTENVRDDPSSWIRLLQIARDNKNKNVLCERLGEKEIDGRRVVGFRIRGDRGPAMDLWGDPKTGMPVRVEMTMGMDGKMKVTLSDFVFDVDMDESLFSVEPPAGYTVRNEKADSSANEEEEKDLIGMLREYSNWIGDFPDSLDLMRTSEAFWKKAQIHRQWERVAPGKGKANQEQMHKFEELMLKIMDGKPNAEQMRTIEKELHKLLLGMLWEDAAPEKLRANEELRRKFEELMLKSTDGKLNQEQERRIEEEIRKIGGDQLLKALEAQHAQTQKTAGAQTQETAEVREAQTRKFMEAQQRIHRGLAFANRLPPSADAHYAGKGVSLNAADAPIFWYRPKDAKRCRVIYADLSVRDADTPPNVPKAQPARVPSSPKK